MTYLGKWHETGLLLHSWLCWGCEGVAHDDTGHESDAENVQVKRRPGHPAVHHVLHMICRYAVSTFQCQRTKHRACPGHATLHPAGYECKEFNCSFMVAFAEPCLAVEWAITLQMALMEVPWPADLGHMEAAADVWDHETKQVCSLV